MKLNTFYNIYYRHRVEKSNFIKILFIFLLLPINYLVNLIFLEKKINLDKHVLTNQNLLEKDLTFLFEKFNSDKGDKFINQYQKPIKKEKELIDGHKYSSFYEKYLNPKKNQITNILELGTFKGNATASLFYFFSNAVIDSVDLYPDLSRYDSKRINKFKVDTSSKDEIQKKILNNSKQYELIIEDAGHYLKDQIISLFMLFPKLKSGGIFVIEELDFPNVREDMNIYNEKPTLRDILNLILDKKDFNSDYITHLEKDYFLKNFKSINVYKGKFNEIAFIEKK